MTTCHILTMCLDNASASQSSTPLDEGCPQPFGTHVRFRLVRYSWLFYELFVLDRFLVSGSAHFCLYTYIVLYVTCYCGYPILAPWAQGTSATPYLPTASGTNQLRSCPLYHLIPPTPEYPRTRHVLCLVLYTFVGACMSSRSEHGRG